MRSTLSDYKIPCLQDSIAFFAAVHSFGVVGCIRCVTKKRLPLPKRLPRCLGGSGHREDFSDESPPTSPRDRGKGSVRKRYPGTPNEEEHREGRNKNEAVTADPSVMLRQDAAAFKAGKLTAAGFYATLARLFGNKRDTMVPKV